ncbi:hypothetical protein F4677DRAFT_409557 [Hypoxylon crocopeplum]|nr:hypothetical protein F4677DRAFT_409557 [Hypoxylon crocopeplum]
MARAGRWIYGDHRTVSSAYSMIGLAAVLDWLETALGISSPIMVQNRFDIFVIPSLSVPMKLLTAAISYCL